MISEFSSLLKQVQVSDMEWVEPSSCCYDDFKGFNHGISFVCVGVSGTHGIGMGYVV